MSEQDPRSITAVMHGIVGNVEDLVQAQVGLAKAELLEVAQQAARAAKLLYVGAALGQLAVGVVLLACVNLLASQLPFWEAALIIGAVVGIAALALVAAGVGRFKSIRPSATTSLASHGRAGHG